MEAAEDVIQKRNVDPFPRPLVDRIDVALAAGGAVIGETLESVAPRAPPRFGDARVQHNVSPGESLHELRVLRVVRVHGGRGEIPRRCESLQDGLFAAQQVVFQLPRATAVRDFQLRRNEISCAQPLGDRRDRRIDRRRRQDDLATRFLFPPQGREDPVVRQSPGEERFDIRSGQLVQPRRRVTAQQGDLTRSERGWRDQATEAEDPQDQQRQAVEQSAPAKDETDEIGCVVRLRDRATDIEHGYPVHFHPRFGCDHHPLASGCGSRECDATERPANCQRLCRAGRTRTGRCAAGPGRLR